MADITLNPAFTACHGRMGNLVFVHRRGKQHVRVYAKPTNPDTPAQRERRSAFRDAVRAWQALPDTEKDSWNARARRKNRSGYNLFISRWMNGKEIQAGSGIYPAVAGIQHRCDGSGFTDSSSALSSSSLRSPSVTAPLAPGDSRIYGRGSA